jgi:hypothetical protein
MVHPSKGIEVRGVIRNRVDRLIADGQRAVSPSRRREHVAGPFNAVDCRRRGQGALVKVGGLLDAAMLEGYVRERRVYLPTRSPVDELASSNSASRVRPVRDRSRRARDGTGRRARGPCPRSPPARGRRARVVSLEARVREPDVVGELEVPARLARRTPRKDTNASSYRPLAILPDPSRIPSAISPSVGLNPERSAATPLAASGCERTRVTET